MDLHDSEKSLRKAHGGDPDPWTPNQLRGLSMSTQFYIYMSPKLVKYIDVDLWTVELYYNLSDSQSL